MKGGPLGPPFGYLAKQESGVGEVDGEALGVLRPYVKQECGRPGQVAKRGLDGNLVPVRKNEHLV